MTPLVRLSDLCSIQSGGTPRRGRDGYYGGCIPWVKIGDMGTANAVVVRTEETLTMQGLEAIGGRLFPAGTILLAMYGSVGKTAIAGVPLATNQAILGIQVLEASELDRDYLRRWLQSNQPTLVHGARGVTQPNISATFVRDLRIPVPALTEQRRIASILDAADAVRRKRREGLGLLDELLRSVFLEAFGDPVRNEKGWVFAKMGDVATDTQYGTSILANEDGQGLPVLRMNNLTTAGAIDLSRMKWCEIAPGAESKYTVQRGDLLFNRTNSPELVGKTAVWDREGSYAFAGYLVRVRFDLSRVLPEYVSAYLNSAYGKQMLRDRAKPSNNMSNISAGELRRITIPVPPVEIQQRFVRVLRKVQAAATRMEICLASAGALANGLAATAFRRPTE